MPIIFFHAAWIVAGDVHNISDISGMNCRRRQFMLTLTAWIVAGDDLCCEHRHELSPATIHATATFHAVTPPPTASVNQYLTSSSWKSKVYNCIKYDRITCKRPSDLSVSGPSWTSIHVPNVLWIWNMQESGIPKGLIVLTTTNNKRTNEWRSLFSRAL